MKWRSGAGGRQGASSGAVWAGGGGLQGVSYGDGEEELGPGSRQDTGCSMHLSEVSSFRHHPVFLLPGMRLLEDIHCDYSSLGGLSLSSPSNFEHVSIALYGSFWIHLGSLRPNPPEVFSSQVPCHSWM